MRDILSTVERVIMGLRDLDKHEAPDHTIVTDEDGDMIDLYTVDGMTFIGTREAGNEEGFAVRVDRRAARIIVATLIRRVLAVSPGRTCTPTGVEGHGQIECGYACNWCGEMSANEDDPCPSCSVKNALNEVPK
jgi:hypothetical protein